MVLHWRSQGSVEGRTYTWTKWGNALSLPESTSSVKQKVRLHPSSTCSWQRRVTLCYKLLPGAVRPLPKMMQAMREESVTAAVLRRSISPYKTSGSLLTFVTAEETPTRRRAYIVLGGVCPCVVGSLSRNGRCVSWCRLPVHELVLSTSIQLMRPIFSEVGRKKGYLRTFPKGFLDLHSLYEALHDVTTSKRRTI